MQLPKYYRDACREARAHFRSRRRADPDNEEDDYTNQLNKVAIQNPDPESSSMVFEACVYLVLKARFTTVQTKIETCSVNQAGTY